MHQVLGLICHLGTAGRLGEVDKRDCCVSGRVHDSNGYCQRQDWKDGAAPADG
jgi:hypothetical protein